MRGNGLDTLNVDLKNFSQDYKTIEVTLGDEYFSSTEDKEIKGGDVSVRLDVHRVTDKSFDINFHIEGEVEVECCRCLDNVRVAVATDRRLMAKLGGESDGDTLLAVDDKDGILDISWLIYEFVALSLPINPTHAKGECNSDMMRILGEHSAEKKDEEETTDPRWDKLKNLKSNN